MLERILAKLLLQPSLFSGLACIFVVATMLVVRTWQTLSHASPSTDHYGQNIAFALADTTSALSLHISAFLSQSWIYYALLTAVAIAIGIVVYVVLQASAGLATTISETAQTNNHTMRQAFGESIGARLLVRFIVIAVSIMYWQLCLAAIVPACLALWDSGLGTLNNSPNWLLCLAAVSGLLVMCHVHIILARLFFLRPRVFGGKYKILEALQ